MGKPSTTAPPAGGYRDSDHTSVGHARRRYRMGKTRLLQAVCTVAMLAAVPALAQRPEAGLTGPNGAPNPAAQQTGQGMGQGIGQGIGQQTAQNSDPNTAPANANDAGSSPSAAGDQSAPMGHSMHHPAMRHHAGATREGADSQNAAVDRLNEQSYQAAQQGQAFGSNGPGAG